MDTDPKVKELMYATGIDEKLATLLIEFTGGDVNGGKKIVESMPKDYIVLKVRYMGHKTHYYGIVLIVLNLKTKDIDDLYVIVDKNIEASQINSKLKFEDFKEGIVKYIKERNPNLDMIGRLRESINTMEFKDSIFNKLGKDNKFDTEQLKLVFSELFFKVLTESNCAIKIEIEEVDLFRLHKSSDEYIIKREEEHDLDDDKSEDYDEKKQKEEVHIRNISLVLLKIEAVLSPIKGIPISEMQPGDQIMVKIIDEREIGDYLAKLLGAKENEELLPVSATIKEMSVQEETGSVMMLVHFGPGIAGKMFIPPEIKVETPVFENEDEKFEVSGFFKMNPVVVIVILIAIFIIFLILTIFMNQ